MEFSSNLLWEISTEHARQADILEDKMGHWTLEEWIAAGKREGACIRGQQI